MRRAESDGSGLLTKGLQGRAELGLAGEGSWACAAVTQPTLAVNGDRIELDAAENEQDCGTGSRVFAGACWDLQRRARSPAAQGEGDR